jgi:hypothetical protein
MLQVYIQIYLGNILELLIFKKILTFVKKKTQAFLRLKWIKGIYIILKAKLIYFSIKEFCKIYKQPQNAYFLLPSLQNLGMQLMEMNRVGDKD